jgi:hypothetical protein
MVVEAVRSVQGCQVEKEAIAIFIYAMVDMEVVYGAEASGGQYRLRLLEGEDSDSDDGNYRTDGDN